MLKKFTFVTILFFISVSVFSTASQAGAIFLMIYPGSRAVGMGGAYTAISDDALAVYYNPAGMGMQEKRDVVLMHVEWLPALQPGMYYEYLGAVFPTEYGVFGGSINYLTTGEMSAVDDDPTARWVTYDLAVNLSYSYKLNQKLSLGGTGKFIYSYLAPEWVVRSFLGENQGGQGQSVALDLGVLYKPTKNTSLGFTLANIGPSISYIENGEKDPLPLTLRLGVKQTLFANQLNDLLLAADITKVMAGIPFGSLTSEDLVFEPTKMFSKDSDSLSTLEKEVLDTWVSIGLEYLYYNLFAVRAGYFVDYFGQRIGFTFGGGFIIKNSIRIDIGVDSNIYQFATSNYRISLGFRF